MAIHTHHLCTVPGKEGSGGLSDLGRMFDEAEAYGAALALIAQDPAQAE
jgi:hypothetical protein